MEKAASRAPSRMLVSIEDVGMATAFKRGFNLLVYGFRLLAPERAAAAPALTLPTGP